MMIEWTSATFLGLSYEFWFWASLWSGVMGGKNTVGFFGLSVMCILLGARLIT